MTILPELRDRVRGIKFQNKRVLALGLVFLAAGIYIRWATWPGKWKELLGASCDALLIAAFLSIAVDPILKKELVTDASQDIFLYAFGYSLPEELRTFMNNLLLKTKIVRRQCHLKWHLTPKPEDSQKVEVNLDASFYIVNFSDEDLEYQHKVFSWKENAEDVGCVRKMYCVCSDPTDTGYSTEREKGLVSDADGLIVGAKIKLIHQAKRDRYRIGAVYYTETGWPGLDQFTIMETTTDIQVTVVVDSGLSNLVFSVVPDPSGTNQSENYKLPSRNQNTDELTCTWKLDRVFVQNERVSIRWKHRGIATPSFEILA
jgi:hypothetical protein